MRENFVKLSFNLNNEIIMLNKLPKGKTQNIEIKIGHRLYMMDIDKD